MRTIAWRRPAGCGGGGGGVRGDRTGQHEWRRARAGDDRARRVGAPAVSYLANQRATWRA